MSFQTVEFASIVDAKALTVSATNGEGIITLSDQSVNAGTPASGTIALFADSSNRLSCIHDSGFVAVLDTSGITADRVFTFPDYAATLVGNLDTTLSNLSSIGTITTGVWNGTLISPTYGGTGVNNGSNTITVGGNVNTAADFITTGANSLTLNTTGATVVTLPTSGTLITTAVTSLPFLTSAASLNTVGTITTGVWNGTTIGVTYGGTGATSFAAGGLLYGNGTSPVAASTGSAGELLVSGGAGAPTWSTGLTFTGGKLVGVVDPTNDTDAANKRYVDQSVAGLTWKTSARVGTTANLTAVYNNGASGVGATLTNNGAQVALSLDGVATAAGNRVLVKNQTDQTQNGIYEVTDIGSGSTNWVLTRTTDADNSPSNELNSAAIFITEGSTNSTTSWVQNTAGTTIGTSNIVWSQFGAASIYTAGVGLDLVGNAFSLLNPVAVNLGGTGFASYTAGDLIYASGATALSKLAAGGTNQVLHGGVTPSWGAVNLSTETTGVLPIANGGTNSSAALNNDRIIVSSGGSIVEASALTNGQLLIGSTGAAPIAAAITGTSNQVNVTNGAGSITLSLPQNIHTAATPTFASETLSATTNQLVLGTTNTTTLNATAPIASRVYTIPDAGANTSFIMSAGAQTITGNKTFSGTNNYSALTASKPLQLTAGNNVTAADIALTTQVTGVLPAANGGTGFNGSAAANGSLPIGNGAGFTNATLTAGTGISIVNGAGSVTISATTNTLPQIIPFATQSYNISSTNSSNELAQLPYDFSRLSAYTTATVTLYAIPSTGGRDLTVEIRNDGVTVLGTIAVPNGSANGIYTFNLSSFPASDTVLTLHMYRSGGAGPNPRVNGVTIEFTV